MTTPPTTPRVSFVVPCYKLAHLLRDCVESILSQSYRDVEVLIMDDCSPDDTPSVAASFDDSRVRSIRNPVNLGHVRNYNEGIRLSRGEYVWIMSADDRLRSSDIVERYARLLDERPDVGMAFCPGVNLHDGGREGDLHGSLGAADVVFEGHELLDTLLQANCVCTPGALVRRSCYEAMGMYPIDLPYACDWYVWCAVALHHRVAYFGAPMVHYRYHDTNITKRIVSETPDVFVSDLIAVRWRIKRLAERHGTWDVVRICRTAIGNDYALRVRLKTTEDWWQGLTLDAFEQSLRDERATMSERAAMRATVYTALGDDHYDRGDVARAQRCYRTSIAARPWMLRTRAKAALLRLDGRGRRMRELIGAVRGAAGR